MHASRRSSPHQHIRRNTGQVMRLVIYAALPGLLVQTWFFGWGAIIHLLLASLTAVATEAAILELRKRDFETAIKDSSALLTALLIAISIPPLAPWWITVIGTFFAIGIVKQLYGGLGYNLFNPAMAAYVMLLVSFPVQMTNWLPPAELSQHSYNFVDALYMIFTGFSSEGYSITQLRTDFDGITLATPLDHTKTQLLAGQTISEIQQSSVFENGLGIGWAWVNLAYLLGGLVLLKLNVIKWQIPVGMLGGALVLATVFHWYDSDLYSSPVFHLLTGGMMLGAFFIATDPVSASTTDRGRLIFGAGIGIWVILIRQWGGYPDAIAFGVLIMNMAVPLIDHFTRPRTYGYDSEHKKSIPEKAVEKEQP